MRAGLEVEDDRGDLPEGSRMSPRARRLAGAAAVIALGALAKFASAPGQSFLLAVFVDDVIAETGTGRTGFSVMYGAATVFSAATVLALGRAIDARGVAAVWAAVAAGLAAGCLLLSAARGPAAVFAGLSMMRAFGQGSFPLVGTVLVASRFEAARGRAIGLSTQGITLATAVLPAACVALIAANGWRGTLQLIALALAAGILPLAIAVRRVEGRRRPAGGRPVMRVRESLRLPAVPSLLAVLCVPPLVVTAVVLHAVSIVGEQGLGAPQAAAAIGLMAVTTVLGSLVGGWLMDRLAPRVVLSLMGAVLAACLALLLVPLAAAAYLAYATLGIAAGLHLAAAGSVWAKAYGTADLGRLQSLGGSGQIAGAAAGPLPLALSLSLTGSYAPGIAGLAGLALLAIALAWRWPGRATPGVKAAGWKEADPPEAVSER